MKHLQLGQTLPFDASILMIAVEFESSPKGLDNKSFGGVGWRRRGALAARVPLPSFYPSPLLLLITIMSEHPIHSKGWQDAYEAPRDRSAVPLPRVDVQELQKMLERQANGGATEVVVVDVRRADCEVS